MSPRTITETLILVISLGYCTAGQAADTPPHLSLSDSFAQKSLETRKKLIHRHLPLTAAEAERFWPIYDEYQKELTQVYIQRKTTLAKLGAHFDSMTDKTALQFVEDYMNLQEERLRIMHIYMQKLETALPGKKLLRFFQIENRFRSAVDAEIAEKIPLLK